MPKPSASPLPVAAARQVPGWVLGISDEDLREQVGEDTFGRGAAYHRQGRVTSVVTGRDGGVLLASVVGSGGRTYQTLVTAEMGAPDDPEPLTSWLGRCSCPVQVDCKHVVALILTARERHAATGPGRATDWEQVLAPLVRAAPEEPRPGAPLALLVEVTDPAVRRYAVAVPRVRQLRLRPLTTGRKGGWIRTGAGWNDVEYDYGRSALDRAQRQVLLGFLGAARARSAGYYYADQNVTSDMLGPGLWRLLREAEEAGIPLVSGPAGSASVTLAGEPAAVSLDARQDADGRLTLSPRLSLPGGTLELGEALASTLGFIGDPAHGVVVQEPDRVVLAAFEQPLDRQLGALLRRDEPLQIPEADVSRFLSFYYPVLRRRTTLECSDGSVSLPEVLPPRLVLSVRFETGHVAWLRWSFSYPGSGQAVMVPVGARTDETGPRDTDAESALLASLDVLDTVPGLRSQVRGERRLVPEVRLHGMETATFVAQVLPVLQQRDDVLLEVGGTPADYAEALEAPLIAVSATDPGDAGGQGSDWFDLGVTVTIAGEVVPFMPLFTALARREDHLLLDSGTWFSLDRPELQALSRLIEEARSLLDHEAQGLRVTRWHAGLWEELVELGVVAHQSERWSRTVGALLDLDSVPRPDPPVGLKAELRHYQLEGYHWLSLLWDHQLGGILADDMGLGKTLQTLAMAQRALEQGTLGPDAPLLIVAPTSVVSTWAREAARFCPDLVVTAVTQTERKRGMSLSEQAAGAHLVVTSFALLRLDESAYRGQTWSGLILDEAQFVKNHQAKTYQVARRLPAPFKLAITGTPLENSLMDLWSLLSIVAPGLWPSPQKFTELYRRPIEGGQAPELLATLRRRVRPLMLRRTKEAVATDLPPKVEQVLGVTLNPAHHRAYQTRLQRERQRILGMLDDVDRNRIAILRSLTVLRQLSLDVSLVDPSLAGKVRSSKIDALVETLGAVVAEGHRALVFSQFTGFLRLVRERLAEEGIDHVYLDGRTRNRPQRIAEFTEGTAPAFLISLKAGGSGLTLTEADYVFVLDPWWNPAVEAQAVDRTHRIGQDKTVMVYRLVAEGTIEEKVVELQERKRQLFARVVDADGVMGAPLSADDIRGLLEA